MYIGPLCFIFPLLLPLPTSFPPSLSPSPQEYRQKLLNLDCNQKLGLLRAAIQLGDWPTASSLLPMLPPLLPAWCPGISQALCQYLHYVLEPLYRGLVCLSLHLPPSTSLLSVTP